MPGAMVIGAGPGLGAAIAHRFAREGLPVSLMARRHDALHDIAGLINRGGGRALPVQADAGDEDALRSAIDRAVDEFGIPDVVVYNAALIQRDSPGDLTAHQLTTAYAVNVIGAITAAAHIAPAMASRGQGSFLITSGMPRAVAQYTSLSLGKAAVRALADILDQQFGPAGVHVATVTVYGTIVAGTSFDPDAIADRFWLLHRQPRSTWELDHAYIGT